MRQRSDMLRWQIRKTIVDTIRRVKEEQEGGIIDTLYQTCMPSEPPCPLKKHVKNDLEI